MYLTKYRVIEFKNEENYIKDFLLLPKLLYDKKTFTQDETAERKIIEETHVLNKYFKQHKFLVYDREEKVCGRCVLTIYDGAAEAYIGYFECIEEDECAALIFAAAEECAQKAELGSIIGPVDSSFWIKYRLKIDSFDRKPYVGEPYNKPYYKKMFSDNGYAVLESWVSNIYRKTHLLYNRKTIYKERLNTAKASDYKIVSPNPKDFDETLVIIYELISETFSEFVTFKKISLEDFREIFKNYKYILDYHFFKIVYHNEEAVAFSIMLPDYQNLLHGKLTVYKKIRILLKKIRSENYVSLYMGVKKEHRGLGKALAQTIVRNTYIRFSGCIGALITEGKITEHYAKEQLGGKIRHVLFKKEI